MNPYGKQMKRENDLAHYLKVLLLDYKEKGLLQHITIACSDYKNLERIDNKVLCEQLEYYLQQLELDDQIKHTSTFEEDTEDDEFYGHENF